MSGSGQRFRDAGYTSPKPLILVDGEPMIHHVTRMFPGADFIFIYNETHEDVKQVLKDLYPNSVHVPIAPHKQGPVYTLLCAEHAIPDDEEVIVSYCDYGTQWDFQSFVDTVRGFDGGIAAYIGFHPHMLGPDHYAYIQHENMVLTDIREKEPFTDNKMNEYASNGTYYVRSGRLLKECCRKLIESGEAIKGEYYVSMIYKYMDRVRVFEIQKMLQWGTPRDLEEYHMWSNFFKAPPLIPRKMNGVTILPMAGEGSRFAVQGYTCPKPFLPINGQPMVLRALECLPTTDETYIIKRTHHQVPDVHAHVMSIDHVTDGQATTCAMVIEKLPQNCPVLVSACDNGAYYDTALFESYVNDLSNDVIVWSFHNHPTSKQKPHMYAWLKVNDNGYITDVSVKKPFDGCKHAIIGTMFFRSAKMFMEGYRYIVENKIQTNGEYYVDNLLKPLIDFGYNVKVFPVDYYLCWGTPDDYRVYNYWQEYFDQK